MIISATIISQLLQVEQCEESCSFTQSCNGPCATELDCVCFYIIICTKMLTMPWTIYFVDAETHLVSNRM